MTDALSAAASLVVAPSVAAALIRRAPERLLVQNWTGRRVPAVLGIGLVAGLVSAVPVHFLAGADGAFPETALLGVISATVMAFVGWIDDVAGGSARGFREHLRSLVRLRLTTGGLKLLVGVTLATFLAIRVGGPPERIVATVLLIAISTNLANALDVRPGRALKLSLPILLITWAAASDPSAAWLGAVASGAAVGLLPLDISERGMLGDTGANPLGLLTGLALALVLPTWGVLLAAGLALGLQLVAETVTISRVIEVVPPLRWFDGLGRRK